MTNKTTFRDNAEKILTKDLPKQYGKSMKFSVNDTLLTMIIIQQATQSDILARQVELLEEIAGHD